MNLPRVSRNCHGGHRGLHADASQAVPPSSAGSTRNGSPSPTTTPTTAIAWRDAGYRSVYCAEAELYHHEGLSRGFTDDPRELAAFREVHGHRVDPYFSPHFDPEIETFETKPTVVPIGSAFPADPAAGGDPQPELGRRPADRIRAGEAAARRRERSARRSSARARARSAGPTSRRASRSGWSPTWRDCAARIAPGSSIGRRPPAWPGRSRDGGYEVVHANTLQTFWAVEAARVAGVPSVWSVHESEPWQTCYQRPAERDRRRLGPRLPVLPVSRRLLRTELAPRSGATSTRPGTSS